MNSIHDIVYSVRDLDAAKAVQTALLGIEPHTDTPYYVGYNVGGFEIALAPTRDDQLPSPILHVQVEDIEAALTRLTEAGATLASAPRDVGGGLIASVTDADGNVLGLMQGSEGS